MFRQKKPPTGTVVVKANWNDNPWFPAVLEQERKDCLTTEPEQYDHVWEGGYVSVAAGAYFARHLNEARLEQRISQVTPDPNLVCRIFVDIGGTGARADNFVMWVAQFVGTQIRWIDHYEAQGQDVATHLAWLRERKYTPDHTQMWLPHDGATQDRVIDISYESAFQGAGYEVTVVPNQGKGAAKMRIDEARRLFSSMWFDEERCAAGLEALGWYHEKRDQVRNVGLGPSHDWSSHSADAFGLACIVHDVGPQRVFKPIKSTGWRG
jgi:phage terminase large subunit